MRIVVSLPAGPEMEVEMPAVPSLEDRIYNILGRACVIVYKVDWDHGGNGRIWNPKVWVR